jgi:hypothetical protein
MQDCLRLIITTFNRVRMRRCHTRRPGTHPILSSIMLGLTQRPRAPVLLSQREIQFQASPVCSVLAIPLFLLSCPNHVAASSSLAPPPLSNLYESRVWAPCPGKAAEGTLTMFLTNRE